MDTFYQSHALQFSFPLAGFSSIYQPWGTGEPAGGAGAAISMSRINFAPVVESRSPMVCECVTVQRMDLAGSS